jgi:hypothetical protein
MKEYQAVMLRLTHHPRDDEDALTDLLNERSRAGWEPALIAHGGGGAAGRAGGGTGGGGASGDRLTVVFQRVTTGER